MRSRRDLNRGKYIWIQYFNYICWKVNENLVQCGQSFRVLQLCTCTVEPHSTDTCLIRTPGYNGQFRLFRRKAYVFSLKLTPLIRTPVSTDNRHFSVFSVFCLIHSQPHFTDTFYLLFVLSIFNLSKGLFNIQFHLVRVSTKKGPDFFK